MEARTHAWTPVSTDVSNAATVEEALKTADLDWQVSLEPIQTVDGLPIPRRMATVRTRPDGSRDVLEVIGRKYAPLQNAEAFAFANELVDPSLHKLKLARAFQKKNGRVVGLVLDVTDADVPGIVAGDEHTFSLVLRTSHDGTKAISAAMAAHRLDCTNEVEFTLKNSPNHWSIRHTSSLEKRLAEAARSLGLVHTYTEQFKVTAESLDRTTLELSKARELLDKALPPVTRETTATVVRHRDELLEQVMGVMRDSYKPTAWGLLNAYAEWHDHLRPSRSAQARMDSALDGGGAKVRDRIVRLALR